ncbi:Rho termination factor N-terminal domain-containing protein [Micromonospora sp. DT47]|uniref:Rho termination factor N-terminal domain-containing protein n=1 Tax=Micromonospora sp. DT47 TaxID=3393431 RepID=UPI003CF36499
MTDATLASAVLVRVAELLRKLPAADVTALAEGRARLAVVPAESVDRGPVDAGATRTPASRRAAAPATDLGRAREALAGTSSRHDGTAYLSSWTASDLRALAAQLEVRGVSGLRKADLIDRIVDRTIGFRLNSSAIRQL